jgi:hypothetical protein
MKTAICLAIQSNISPAAATENKIAGNRLFGAFSQVSHLVWVANSMDAPQTDVA